MPPSHSTAIELPEPFAHRPQFLAVGAELLRALLPLPKGVRLLGLKLSGFPGEKEEEAWGDEREPALPFLPGAGRAYQRRSPGVR